MVDRLKNKKGMMSIYAILMLCILIPTLFFMSIDLPYMMRMNRNLKNALDNATATAITYLNEDKISSGILEIDSIEATKIVNKVIQEYFYLNDDLSPNENSLINVKPTVNVKIVNDATGETINTPNGSTLIKNSSVIVYAEFPIEAPFTGATRTIKHTAISQVKFRQ